MKFINCLQIFFITASILTVEAALLDYVRNFGGYFGYNEEHKEVFEDEFIRKIPYEVSTVDDNFLSEAAKLTGVALSELDSCQQRVVLKLQSECNRLNDEQLAKMAVHLLNCQSYVEGRQTFPCTDEMSIKDCTTNMDSDTWTSYHLMSNRARAVCYTIRQSQFRGLAEHTVNRLMEAARDQLNTLLKIAANQENLQNIAEGTYNTLEKGHEILSNQQKDIQMAQFHGQLAIEDNINRLVEEKRLILETHNQLIEMTQNVQTKLENSALQLENQSDKSRINHEEIIDDLVTIQSKAHEIFSKIDESAQLLIKQNEDFRKQYEFTLKNLAEVNKTVHNLVTLVGGTRQALEERLSWITTALGGTDLAVDRLYVILWHFIFMLLAMLSCAFLAARAFTRVVVTTLPPLNLAVALYGEQRHLDAISLGAAIGAFISVQTLILWIMSFRKEASPALQWFKSATKKENSPEPSNDTTVFKLDEPLNETTSYEYKSSHSRYCSDETDDFDSLTPPLSRVGQYSVRSRSRSSTPLKLNGSLRGICHAKTRVGTPCKLSSLPGREFCYRHQTGDSVMG